MSNEVHRRFSEVLTDFLCHYNNITESEPGTKQRRDEEHKLHKVAEELDHLFDELRGRRI